jgi:hypothetical protein
LDGGETLLPLISNSAKETPRGEIPCQIATAGHLRFATAFAVGVIAEQQGMGRVLSERLRLRWGLNRSLKSPSHALRLLVWPRGKKMNAIAMREMRLERRQSRC